MASDPSRWRGAIEDLDIAIEPFLRADAECASAWRAATREQGGSLGDRACLVLAWRLGVPALTTDRAWQDLALPVHVKVLGR